MLSYDSLMMVGPFPSPKCETCGFEYHGPLMGAGVPTKQGEKINWNEEGLT